MKLKIQCVLLVKANDPSNERLLALYNSKEAAEDYRQRYIQNWLQNKTGVDVVIEELITRD